MKNQRSITRVWRGGTLSLAVFLTAAGIPLAQRTGELPLTPTTDGLYLANARVAGQDGAFVLDTGAEVTALEPAFAARAKLGASSASRRVIGLTQIEDAGIASVDIDAGPIRRVSSDAAILKEALPYPAQADGLLGLSALLPDDAAIVEIDFRDHVFRFHTEKTAPRPNFESAWLDLQSSPDNLSVWMVPVDLDRVTGAALIDTGVPFLVMNEAYEAALDAKGRLERIEITGFDDSAERPEIVRIKRLKLGSVVWKNVPVYVLESPAFEALGRKGKPTLILGASVFKDMKLVVDIQTGRLVAAPPEYFDGDSRACTGSRISCAGNVTRMTRG